MNLLAALLLDALFGNPRRLPHLSNGFARLEGLLEERLYGDGSRIRGFLFCILMTAIAGLIAWTLVAISTAIHPWVGTAVETLLLYLALSFGKVKNAASEVQAAVAAGRIITAREALEKIVRHDTGNLDEAGICRTCIEAISKNAVDAVIAPLFWAGVGLFLGQAAPFLWMFMAVSTLDAIIGIDNTRYGRFGAFTAHLDDVLNWIPARLGALLILWAGAIQRLLWHHGLDVVRGDRLKHKSPNTAHGQSAFAGLIGVCIGGGAAYDGEWVAQPMLHLEGRKPNADDITSALALLNVTALLCFAIVAVLTIFLN